MALNNGMIPTDGDFGGEPETCSECSSSKDDCQCDRCDECGEAEDDCECDYIKCEECQLLGKTEKQANKAVVRVSVTDMDSVVLGTQEYCEDCMPETVQSISNYMGMKGGGS